MSTEDLLFLIGKLTVEKELLIKACEERDARIRALEAHECQPEKAGKEN